MAFQYGSTLRTNQVGQLQSTVGASPLLRIYSAAEAANCAATEPTGLLCTITLPSTWLTSSGGVATLSGTWAANATAAGTAQSFRIYDSSATTCHIQGNTSADLVLNNNSIASGQNVSVTSFSVTAGNA